MWSTFINWVVAGIGIAVGWTVGIWLLAKLMS